MAWCNSRLPPLISLLATTATRQVCGDAGRRRPPGAICPVRLKVEADCVFYHCVMRMMLQVCGVFTNLTVRAKAVQGWVGEVMGSNSVVTRQTGLSQHNRMAATKFCGVVRRRPCEALCACNVPTSTHPHNLLSFPQFTHSHRPPVSRAQRARTVPPHAACNSPAECYVSCTTRAMPLPTCSKTGPHARLIAG